MDETTPHNAFRASDEPFTLANEDRFRHVFVAGKTGVGKSTLLYNTALEDITAGHGVAFIDPHGDEAEHLLDSIPSDRTNDVVYLNVGDADFPVSFNPVSGVPLDERPRRTAAIVSSFAHLWASAWGHSTEQIMRNAIATLMDTPGMSLVALPRLLTDDAFRARLVANVTDPLVRAYWHGQFDAYQASLRDQKIAPPQNKIEELLAQPLVRNIFASGSTRIDARNVIDTRKILICNLAKGRIGESATNVMGSLVISLLGLAALSRADITEAERVPFFLVADEVHNFTTNMFAPFLSELRKYKLGLLLASQYMAQLDDTVRDAIFGNVATFVVFRVSPTDAELLAPEFGDLDPSHLTEQRVGRAWVRRDRMFSAWSGSNRASVALPSRTTQVSGQRAQVIARSRRVYAQPRHVVEKTLYRYFQATPRRNSA